MFATDHIHNFLSACVLLKNRIEELLGQGAITEGMNDERVDSDEDEVGAEEDKDAADVKE